MNMHKHPFRKNNREKNDQMKADIQYECVQMHKNGYNRIQIRDYLTSTYYIAKVTASRWLKTWGFPTRNQEILSRSQRELVTNKE